MEDEEYSRVSKVEEGTISWESPWPCGEGPRGSFSLRSLMIAVKGIRLLLLPPEIQCSKVTPDSGLRPQCSYWHLRRSQLSDVSQPFQKASSFTWPVTFMVIQGRLEHGLLVSG